MRDARPEHGNGQPSEQHALFEQVIVPHLDAAYNLARWLTRNDQDAEDVVQEACLRAFRFIGGYRGGDSRAWLLTIVRRTCYTWLQRNRSPEPMASWDDALDEVAGDGLDPEELLLQKVDVEMLRRSLEELPVEFREVVVLYDLEGLTYKEIAHIADVPLGTVMSRLARGRKRLQKSVLRQWDKEFPVEV